MIPLQHEPKEEFDLVLRGVVVSGHGVASGQSASCPYPEGTLALQFPIFRKLGLELSGYFRGTLNINFSPLRYSLKNPEVTFRQVRWTDRIPPEDFSFTACLLEFRGAVHRALIYHPHPETKVEHFQNESLVEVLAGWVDEIIPGSKVCLRVRRSVVGVQTSG